MPLFWPLSDAARIQPPLSKLFGTATIWPPSLALFGHCSLFGPSPAAGCSVVATSARLVAATPAVGWLAIPVALRPLDGCFCPRMSVAFRLFSLRPPLSIDAVSSAIAGPLWLLIFFALHSFRSSAASSVRSPLFGRRLFLSIRLAIPPLFSVVRLLFVAACLGSAVYSASAGYMDAVTIV